MRTHELVRLGLIGIAALALVAGCGKGGGKGADSADDAAEEGAEGEGEGKPAAVDIEQGTKVCISGFVGVRYQIEDAITERGLEPADDCMWADVELAEEGDAGAWVLKHREVGGEWAECKSAEQDRTSFLNECFGAMGAPPPAAAE